MLPDLTRYLLEYKKLSIPDLGTFEILQQAPEYNVVDKLITPPQYEVRHFPHEQVSDHQLHFLASVTNSDKASALNQLHHFGKRLKAIAEKESFTWKGIGAIKVSGGYVNFQSGQLSVKGLGNIDANRVLRENVEHSRLVGDQQISSNVATASTGKNRWGLPVKWAWAVLIIIVLIIVFILFKNHFSPLGTGLKWKLLNGGY